LTISAKISEHILCQMIDTFNFLFFINFLKIKNDKESNFACQFEQVEKNCPKDNQKICQKISLAVRTTEGLSGMKKLPGLVKLRFTGYYRTALARESAPFSSQTPNRPWS